MPYRLAIYRLEAAQRLVLTAMPTLEEDIITCQGEKADVGDREKKTEESSKRLEENLSHCATS